MAFAYRRESGERGEGTIAGAAEGYLSSSISIKTNFIARGHSRTASALDSNVASQDADGANVLLRTRVRRKHQHRTDQEKRSNYSCVFHES